MSLARIAVTLGLVIAWTTLTSCETIVEVEKEVVKEVVVVDTVLVDTSGQSSAFQHRLWLFVAWQDEEHFRLEGEWWVTKIDSAIVDSAWFRYMFMRKAAQPPFEIYEDSTFVIWPEDTPWGAEDRSWDMWDHAEGEFVSNTLFSKAEHYNALIGAHDVISK